MLARTRCSQCFAPLRHTLTPAQYLEYRASTASKDSDSKYITKPPPLLDQIPREMHIQESDDRRTRHIRSGNSPSNVIVADGASSTYDILLMICKASQAGIPYALIFDEKVPFVITGKVLIAAFKMAFGAFPGSSQPKPKKGPTNSWSASITDLVGTSPELTVSSFIDWTKAALEVDSPIEDWTARDAEIRIPEAPPEKPPEGRRPPERPRVPPESRKPRPPEAT